MSRWTVLLILLLFLMPIPVCSAEDGNGVLITAVIPTGQSEGVAVSNFNSFDVMLSEYYLSDGEGTVSFDGTVLKAHSTLYILSKEPEQWMGIGSCIVDGKGAVFNRFALNDSGDDIHLLHGKEVVDSFCYGSMGEVEGWRGDPYPKIPKKHIAVRASLFDTDSSSDWRTIVPGCSDMTPVPEGYDCHVHPFVFPDSEGGPVMDALGAAESRIRMSLYMISHDGIVSILLDLMKKGVKVEILVEGSPAGGFSDKEKGILALLSSKGADVRLMASSDGYRRYPYVHTKYALIDDTMTVITSENWTESSFTRNRGWGVAILSTDVSRYFGEVFESDFNGSLDVKGFKEVYPKVQSADIKGVHHNDRITDWIGCKAFPVVSPDNSWEQMRSLIDGAKERVYCQQLDVSFDWLTAEDNPLQWMLSSVADCRLIMDCTYDSRDDEDTRDSYGIGEALDGNGMSVRVLEGTLVHNKGVVADDSVWIGSVNWTENSFLNNRESAVILCSEEVSDFYASYFISDWESLELLSKGIVIQRPDSVTAGKGFIIGIGNDLPKDAEIRWTIDGETEREGRRIALMLAEGRHVVSVTVRVGDDTASDTIVLDAGASSFIPDMPHTYYVVIAICICVILYNAYRRLKGRKDDKGVQTGGFR